MNYNPSLSDNKSDENSASTNFSQITDSVIHNESPAAKNEGQTQPVPSVPGVEAAKNVSNFDQLTCERASIEEYKNGNTCPHCGRERWCYKLGNLTACKRKADPARGWFKTNACDKDGTPFYAPEAPKKATRPEGRSEYIYTDIDGKKLIKVTVVRPGRNKDKDVYQEYWGGVCWVKAKNFPGHEKYEYKRSVTWYRYAEVKQAIEQGKTIFIAEGEGVVDELWKQGFAATTAIGGAGKYRGVYGANYKQDLEGASQVVLCPDCDKPGMLYMMDINKDFPDAKWLYAAPNSYPWSHLPASGGLDIKDWVMDGATAEDIMAAVREKPLSMDAPNKPNASSAKLSKHEKNFNAIQAVWGKRLRWNSLKKHVELDGKRFTLNRIRTKIAREFHLDLTKEDAKEIVLEIAEQNSYNPVLDYLEGCVTKHKDVSTSILDTLASKYLGTSDPLHALLLKRTLIAAVARTYDPGCKHDNICILQGEQGALKSTFFQVLASKEFFTDDLSGTEKDEVLKLSQYWMLEYSEFETAYRKKEVSQLKAFLSRATDSLRRPYGSDIEEVPRPSIFVGTTNKSEFLQDPTGERRYWVIPVRVKEIDIEGLKRERDLIWAAAVQAYRNKELWYFTKEENNVINASNAQYQVSDAWEEPIAAYILGRPYVAVGDIMSDVLEMELSKRDARSEMRVADCLRKLGWKKAPKQRRINGKSRWVWEKDVNLEDVTAPASEVANPTSSNPNIAVVPVVASQPEQAPSQAPNQSDDAQKSATPDAGVNIQEIATGGNNTPSNEADTNQQQETEVVSSKPLIEQIIEIWGNKTQLGKLVLAASLEELQAAVVNCTPKQIAYIKAAADGVWMPGLNRDVDYSGERCEVLTAGFGREILVKTQAGSKVKVKRANLSPWLGF